MRNTYPHESDFIRLRAVLLGKDNNPLGEQYVFAGNILSDEDLKGLSMPEINTRLSIRGGQMGRNVSIEPRGEIPFMLVFDSLPENLADYHVDVVESSPADESTHLEKAGDGREKYN